MDIKEDLRLVQLQGVPGLDVGVGLATTGQRVESLVRLLKKYAALHADADTRLRQAWSDQAIDQRVSSMRTAKLASQCSPS